MLDRPSQPISWASAVLTLALITACSEPPSYMVRWKLVDEAGLEDPDSAGELTTVKQCADVGVSRVRVTTLEGSVIRDQREYACFPRVFEYGDAVEVPALPPGEYRVEVAGLRRTGEPWACDAEDSATCIAFAEASVTVAEGSLPTVEVALLQPPQCDDGVDNDRDGRVDGKDPACILDPDGPESADANVTLFQLSVTFLDSPAVKPANVSVDGLRLEVDGEPFLDVAASELDTSQWPFRLPLLTERFDAGTHEFSIVAVDGQGTALTSAFTAEFVVSDESAGFLLEQYDFSDDTFLAPVVEPMSATVGLLLNPEDVSGPPCKLGGEVASIERTWFRVTDGGGQPLDAATLALSGLAGGGSITPVDEAGGWISFECPTSKVTSLPLSWGSYQLEIEARIADAICFTSEGPQDLAPVGQSGAQNFYLSRVVDDQGKVPAGCEECTSDADCSGQVCDTDAGLCKDKTP